jgi:hypothetical protein
MIQSRPRTRSIPAMIRPRAEADTRPTRSVRNCRSNRDDLRDIGNRVLGQPCRCSGERDVSRRREQSCIAGQRHHHRSRDPTGVEAISLDGNDRSPKSGARADGVLQRRPADVTLADHHSLPSSDRRAAASPKPRRSAESSSAISLSADHGRRVSPRNVVRKCLAVKLATALAELARELIGAAEQIIGNRDGRLHTKSTTIAGSALVTNAGTVPIRSIGDP